MNPQRILGIYQNSEEAQELAIKNNTTKSICGFIVCAVCQYLAGQEHVNQQTLKNINITTLGPYIDRVMKAILKNRRMEIKKFMIKMNEGQKKSYLTDWVANFQVADYLQSISQKIKNRQLYFFRQCGYDHPQAIQNVKFQEAERVKQQQQFKGQMYFYTSFNPYKNERKQNFVEEIKKAHSSSLPIIIATDVMGHFNVTILLEGRVYVVDSLPYVNGQYDDGILQAINYYYRLSYVKE